MSLRGIEFINTNEEYTSGDEDEQHFKVEILSEIEDEKVEIAKYEENNYTAKCGEIFISNNGKMHFICSFCDINFENAEYFQNHIFKQHLNLIKEEKYDNSEVSMSLEGDTLYGLTTHESDNDTSSSTQQALPKSRNTATFSSRSASTHFSVHEAVAAATKDVVVSEYHDSEDDEESKAKTPVKTIKNPRQCSFCGKQLRSIAERVGHERTHNGEKPYICKECGNNFRLKNQLESHMRTHTGDGSKPKTPVKIIDNSLKCPYCNKQFRDKAQRILHERCHTGKKPYKCKECGNNFRSSRLLKCHMRTHTGERPFSCPHCPGKFSNSTNRNVHVRTHLGIKRFSCELCNKAFVTNRELTVHIRSHTGEKPYKCETCGASFTTAGKLREHNKRHTNTRPHKCDICLSCFYSKTLLNSHKTTHSDKRPFECNLCDARFPLKSRLQSHMKIHSDVKEYVCNICGKAFSQNTGLYCHMKTHDNKLGVKTGEDEHVSE